MSRTVRRALAPALLLVALLAPPSQADHASGADPVGDQIGWQLDPADPFCGAPVQVEPPAEASGYDITDLTVANARWKVRVTLQLAGPHSAEDIQLHLRTPGKRWAVDLIRDGGKRSFDVYPEPTYEPEGWDIDEDGVDDCQVWTAMVAYTPCRPLQVERSAAHDQVTVSIPRRCIGSPRWVRAGAQVIGTVGDGNVVVTDSWSSAGPDVVPDWTTYDPNHYVYGPRVPAWAGPSAQKGSPSNLSRVTKSSTGLRLSLVRTLTGLPIGSTAATAY